MAAVENSRHYKTAFVTLLFEFGSVAVFSFFSSNTGSYLD